MKIATTTATVNLETIHAAAVQLAQTLLRPEYALHVVRRTHLERIPEGYTPVITTQVHSFVYSLWEHRTHAERMLVRLEGVGIFAVAYEDEEPAVAQALGLLYELPQAA